MPVLVSAVDNGTDHGTDHGTGAGINPPLLPIVGVGSDGHRSCKIGREERAK